ncbi:MAG: DUF3015 family protein [Planctomycetes bacterium]|nr:DUF3015 family protein [Planctomycetota bacterium]
MIRTALLVCLLTLVSAPAVEATSHGPGTAPNPYSDCGIGAAIFPTVGWAAAISNVIWDLGSTAITSALSTPDTCNARKVKTATLILETLPGLERDIARADGKHLAALGDVMACSTSARSGLAADLRVSYAGVITQQGYEAKSRTERAFDLYSAVRDVTEASPDSCDVDL